MNQTTSAIDPKQRRRIVGYFLAVQFLWYTATALWSYCNIYFQELGFSGQQIGLISSLGICLATVLLPFLGVLSDRRWTPGKVLAVTVLVLMPCYLLVSLTGMAWGNAIFPMLLLAPMCVALKWIGDSMLDTWGGENLERLHMSYGAIRWCGCLGFVIMVTTASFVIGPVLPTSSTGIIAAVTSLPLFLLVLQRNRFLPKEEPKGRALKASGLLQIVLRNRRFLAYLVLNLGFYAFVALVNMTMPYYLTHLGVRQSMVGLISGFRAAMEIVTMLLIDRIKKRPPIWVLLAIAGFATALEHLLYPFLGGLAGILLISVCTGVAGGLIYGLGANYVLQIVDHRATGTAMSVLGMGRALVGIAGNALGGGVIDRYGILTLTNGIGLVALATSTIFTLACLAEKKTEKAKTA